LKEKKMFSVREKRAISEAVQKVLRETEHPELPEGEIQFRLRVEGAESGSWADIANNGAVTNPSVNQHNENQDPKTRSLFTMGEVAKICKVAPRTVSKWFDSGRLRGYRIPGSQDRRIPREHLFKFLKEHGMYTAIKELERGETDV
jgi:excisionase family DNA binding protein